MKNRWILLLTILLTITTIQKARACVAVGRIFCDVNQNRRIDSFDVGIPSILVIVTNVSGSYSNANWTRTDGVYVVQLQDTPDSYVLFLHPATLPPDSTYLFPIPPLYQFSIVTTNTDFVGGDFLINNPDCQTGGCWLTGGGTVGGTGAQPSHSFGGNVYPGCSSTAGDGGQWTHVAHNLRLQFQGKVVQTVRCGNVAGIPPGSKSPVTPFNLIEFEGTGSLKGIKGNKADFGQVFFHARAEDRAEPGSHGQKKSDAVDRYYLRVFSADGTTRLLVSGDMNNPTNVVTVPVATGNLQMHVSSCETSAPVQTRNQTAE